MIETVFQGIQKGIGTMTPWLVGAAAGCFLLWLALLMREKRPFEEELKWFRGLAPLYKFIVACVICLFTLWGGSKERGVSPSGQVDGISSIVSRAAETVQLRTLPEGVASHAFSVTDFSFDSRGKETAFGVGWSSNLLESVDSRNVDLFMSTNLAAGGWFPLGRYAMPQDTNSYSFTVSSNDIALAYRPAYVDSFGRRAFFRFGLDFDSDGDGLTDSYENLVTLTDSSNPDTDGDGLHYQQDVYQALKTGAALKALVERAQPAPSKRILMAQSLGNMVACEALRQGLHVDKYFMFNAAVASEAVDGTLQNANSTVKAKYVPPDWSDYDSRSWAANWHRWFADDATDSRGRMGWPDYFRPALSRAGTVYNYYSTGDPVFFESDAVPNVTTGLFHWPTLSWSWPFIDVNITAEEGSWQKQETHKGVEPVAGTLRGGWGFDCWYENVGGVPVPTFYAAARANAMAANGSITNSPVFSYGGTPLNNRNASWDDIWLSLAKYVPAVSSPIGGTAAFGVEDHNLNAESYRDGWGRRDNVYKRNWLHSDMKDMAFFYVYPFYKELVLKGMMR